MIELPKLADHRDSYRNLCYTDRMKRISELVKLHLNTLKGTK